MPTYEYECTSCGKVFELFQPITEAPRKKLRKDDPKPCKCDAAVSRRISPGGGLIFKGSGFYITDYRSESYKNAAKSESGEAPKTESTKSDSGKTEAAANATKSDLKSDAASSTKSSDSSKSAPGKSKPSKKSRSE